jgi:predicted kinase
MRHAVLVSGAPGVGKSTVGGILSERLGAALLDLDTATADLTAVVGGLLGIDDLDDPRLAGATRAARYATIVGVAEENLRHGLSVVLVAPFTTERREPLAWAALNARLTAAGGVPSLVWLHVDPAVVAQRVERRAAARDLAKRADGRALIAPDLDAPGVPSIRVAAARPPEQVAAAIVQALPGVVVREIGS